MSVTAAAAAPAPTKDKDQIHWVVSLPFFAVHLAALSAFFVGFHWRDVAVCVALYYVRMFFVTTAYHRYFSHRTFKTSRAFQFLMAVGTTTCAQKGPLWWAAHHRHHHKSSDQPDDVHSPVQRGFWYSHVGWITSGDHIHTDLNTVNTQLTDQRNQIEDQRKQQQDVLDQINAGENVLDENVAAVMQALGPPVLVDGMICPLPGGAFTDDFGQPRPGGRTHQGVDMHAPSGINELAIVNGNVTYGDGGGGGMGAYIAGDDGNRYVYYHLAQYVGL